jgi:HSP20 family protein
MTKVKETKGEVVPRTTRDLSPFEEMDRLFERLFEGDMLRPFDWRLPELARFRRMQERMPRIDVVDRDEEILVRAEVPGVKKEDLEVTLSHDLLTIKAQTREEKEERGEFFRSEIQRGSLVRTVRLPDEVVGEKAKAHFEDGLLEITIPKAEKAARHSIKIL